MKTPRSALAGLLMFVLVACKHASYEETAAFHIDNTSTDETGITSKGSTGPCNPYAYEVILESRTNVNGNWEWVWSVRNPNPGNGTNGTAKDLSHWGFQLADCVSMSTLIGAAYSSDGLQWTEFVPVNQADSGQDCMNTAVIKFDFGTTGTAKSYYRLTLSQEYPADNTLAYYKAGQACCTFTFGGIGCSGGPVEVEVVE
jgi:hypothetical protein